MPNFSTSSAAKLLTCDHRLQQVFNEVIRYADCSILCGHRGKLEQDAAYAKGTSKLRWPESAHNVSPSRAVDVAPYPVVWDNVQRFKEFAVVVKEVAARQGVRLRWGGDFESWKDFPHWELVEP